RAELAREQREAQRLKNLVAKGEYAPIGLLGDVLGLASASLAERLDALPGAIRTVCPDLPAGAADLIHDRVATARNAWVEQTSALVDRALELYADDDVHGEPT